MKTDNQQPITVAEAKSEAALAVPSGSASTSVTQSELAASATGSAPDVRVEMTHLRRCMAYLAIIESVPLEEVLWIEDGKAIPVTPAEIAEWKITGLNNRDFALMYLEGKKAQNAKSSGAA